MTVSKKQRERVSRVCQCGCGKSFNPFPQYGVSLSDTNYEHIKGPRGGHLSVPKYSRGHHPNCTNNHVGGKPWNLGLTKKTNASVGRQGISGSKHWNYDPEYHPAWFSDSFDYVAFYEKYGRIRHNGGHKAFADFRLAVIHRDKCTCQTCGLVADETEELDLLHVHHIEYVSKNAQRMFDPTNVVTLCYVCHRRVHRSNK